MADDLKGKVATVEYLENGAERQLSQKVEIQHNNPLSGLSRAELHDQVEAFCSKYGFEDRLETFHKASMVAQRPHDFESIDELSEDDKHWLRREITSKYIMVRSNEARWLTSTDRQMGSSLDNVYLHVSIRLILIHLRIASPRAPYHLWIYHRR